MKPNRVQTLAKAAQSVLPAEPMPVFRALQKLGLVIVAHQTPPLRTTLRSTRAKRRA